MQSHFTALDLKDPGHHPLEYYTNTGITSGAWGWGGLVLGFLGFLVLLAVGLFAVSFFFSPPLSPPRPPSPFISPHPPPPPGGGGPPPAWCRAPRAFWPRRQTGLT